MNDASATTGPLTRLVPGMAVPFGGDRVATVSAEMAERFRPGDRLLVVQETGDLLLVPAAEHAIAAEAVRRAHEAFARMGAVSDEAVSAFFDAFADALDSHDAWEAIAAANAEDVVRAKAKGRSTTRLAVSPKLRADMVAGLREWRDTPSLRGRVLEHVAHDGWSVEQAGAEAATIGLVNDSAAAPALWKFAQDYIATSRK